MCSTHFQQVNASGLQHEHMKSPAVHPTEALQSPGNTGMHRDLCQTPSMPAKNKNKTHLLTLLLRAVSMNAGGREVVAGQEVF